MAGISDHIGVSTPNGTWAQEVAEAIGNARFDLAIDIVLPFRDDPTARFILAQCYYQCGRDGLAMAMLALAQMKSSLQECIWLRRGIIISAEQCEHEYYQAERAYASADWDTAAGLYCRIQSQDPYLAHADARHTLLAFYERGDKPCKLWKEGAWSYLEGAEIAKHSKDFDSAERLYHSAYIAAHQASMLSRKAHALLGMADLLRMQSDKRWQTMLQQAEDIYVQIDHHWGQRTVELLQGKNVPVEHRTALAIAQREKLTKRPLKLTFPC